MIAFKFFFIKNKKKMVGFQQSFEKNPKYIFDTLFYFVAFFIYAINFILFGNSNSLMIQDFKKWTKKKDTIFNTKTMIYISIFIIMYVILFTLVMKINNTTYPDLTTMTWEEFISEILSGFIKEKNTSNIMIYLLFPPAVFSTDPWKFISTNVLNVNQNPTFLNTLTTNFYFDFKESNSEKPKPLENENTMDETDNKELPLEKSQKDIWFRTFLNLGIYIVFYMMNKTINLFFIRKFIRYSKDLFNNSYFVYVLFFVLFVSGLLKTWLIQFILVTTMLYFVFDLNEIFPYSDTTLNMLYDLMSKFYVFYINYDQFFRSLNATIEQSTILNFGKNLTSWFTTKLISFFIKEEDQVAIAKITYIITTLFIYLLLNNLRVVLKLFL